MDKDTFIGFIMTDEVRNNKYLQIDYLAILPEYQNKGYGSLAIKLLKEKSKQFDAIFIEVESEGYGKDDAENAQRTRRIAFYKKIGFYELNFKLKLYGVMFTPYILPIVDNIEDENKIIEKFFEIYEAIAGKWAVKRHFKLIK